MPKSVKTSLVMLERSVVRCHCRVNILFDFQSFTILGRNLGRVLMFKSEGKLISFPFF